MYCMYLRLCLCACKSIWLNMNLSGCMLHLFDSRGKCFGCRCKIKSGRSAVQLSTKWICLLKPVRHFILQAARQSASHIRIYMRTLSSVLAAPDPLRGDIVLRELKLGVSDANTRPDVGVEYGKYIYFKFICVCVYVCMHRVRVNTVTSLTNWSVVRM